MSTPELLIAPNSALVDEPLCIRLTGFAPKQQVTLTARTTDGAGHLWSSQATFAADGAGVVDLATAAPLDGSYTGADAMGLCWAMAPDPAPAETAATSFVLRGLEPLHVTITASIADEVATTATVERRFLAPGVARVEVRERGLVGTYFRPAGAGPHPTVLALGGSSGGLREQQAALLAAHGIAALALAYFAYDGLPERLANIPLEYFETALEWLAAQPGVDADRLAVMGISRGAELALLLGASYPLVRRVVAISPSAVVWGATGADAPTWTRLGQPVPRMPNRATAEQAAEIFQRQPLAAAPWYSINLDDPAACAAAAIPVERIAGPVLLVSGEEDALWPSVRMGEMIMARLRAHGHPYPDRHLRYPGAGHLIGIPSLPPSIRPARHPALGLTIAYGGNPRDQARANVDSWHTMLAFLGGGQS